MGNSNGDNPLKKLINALEEGNVRLVFGLEAQGHIDTIERMINEYSKADNVNPDGDDLSHSTFLWENIAKEIGWETKTAMGYYIAHLRSKQYRLKNKS